MIAEYTQRKEDGSQSEGGVYIGLESGNGYATLGFFHEKYSILLSGGSILYRQYDWCSTTSSKSQFHSLFKLQAAKK